MTDTREQLRENTQATGMEALAALAPIIDGEIAAELADLDDFMRDAIRYHFGWLDQDFQPVANPNSGKKLRPAMLLLAFQAAKGAGSASTKASAAYDPALPVAACIEMIHNYSLIHDDIEDGDKERRGRATLWAIWGKPIAINVGDCLHVLAFRRLYRAVTRGLSAARGVQVANLVTDTSVNLALGQHMDMSFERDLNVTPDMYEQMIAGKTASLIRCSVLCGALVALDSYLDPGLNVTARTIEGPNGGSREAQLARTALAGFADFGLNIGLGFQIRDDILGIWGETEQTGKTTGNDIRRRKKSLPIITALSRADAPTRARLVDFYSATEPMSEEAVAFVLRALEQTGAHAFAQSEADRFKHAALDGLAAAEAALRALHGTQGANVPLQQLRTLSTFLVERAY